MSDSAIRKIEKTLSKLVAQQEQICSKLEALEQRVSGASGATDAETVRFLDQFRAGEALGETSLGAWIEVSDVACVKGGLRTVQQREGMHARLLEQRIKELGGTPSFELPDAVHDQAMEGSASTDKSDAEKLCEFVTRFPDCDAALQPIYAFAERLDGDPETQSLLRTIAQDERSTLEWFAEANAPSRR